MADLTTTVKVKRALGIPSAVTIHDELIDTLVEVADQDVLGFVGMAAVTATSTTESYDITNEYTTEVVLRNFPVSSVSSVVVGGGTLATTSYYLDSNTGVVRLQDNAGFFPPGSQEVEVSYSYGFSTIPADLSFAATIIATAHFNRVRHSGLVGEGMGAYRYTMDPVAFPKSAAVILSRYRRIFPRDSQP